MNGPKLQITPDTAIIQKDSSVTFTISIDTDGNSAIGSDAIIAYPGNDVSISAVANGGFFPNFASADDTTNHRLEIHGYYAAQFGSRSGTGTLATFTVKGISQSGSGTISFICSGNTATKILDTNGNNILNCSSLNQAGITYTGVTQPTSTPTPTATPIPTPTTPPGGGGDNTGGTGSNLTPSPTSAPNTVPTCTGLIINPKSGSTVPYEVTLSCSGIDPDGDITGAEFQFGDGQKRLVEQNVGSPGSLSTNYRYPGPGTIYPSCRVRDNNFTFSSSCSSSLELAVATNNTAGASGIFAVKPKPTPTSIATISPTQVELVPYISPTPATPAVILTPTATAKETATRSPLATDLNRHPCSRHDWHTLDTQQKIDYSRR